MNISGRIFNDTGGIKYHLRAILNKKRWRPFCEYVESWLQDWLENPKVASASTLVLIGPNAGYTLSPFFISQFQNVIAVEPDPLAFVLFEARFNCRARWVKQDYFDLDAKIPNPEKIRGLFLAYPNAVFLFCNMLGQLPVLLRDKKGVDVDSYMKCLGEILSTEVRARLIASYHDRYSCNLKQPNIVVDHLTGELFTGVTDKKEFPWRISSREEHQIEFVRSDFV